MLATYGVDLVRAVETGSPSPRFLLALIEGLPSGSWSSSVLADCPEMRGYSPVVAAIADVFDAVAVNTVVCGNLKKGAKPEFWPGRPKLPEKPVGRPKSVADLARLFAPMVGE